MLALGKVLVVDPSSVFRMVLSAALGPHCEEIFVASDLAEARDTLARLPGVSLVLARASAGQDDGFELLRCIGSRGEGRPDVILVAEQPNEQEALRARELGAAGYLREPVSLNDIARAIERKRRPLEARGERQRVFGLALLVDPQTGRPRLAWNLVDLSTTGAFIETTGPIPLGTDLELMLFVGPAMVVVRARVVRIQEPSWSHSAGVGVQFASLGQGARDLLNAALDDPPSQPTGGSNPGSSLVEPQ